MIHDEVGVTPGTLLLARLGSRHMWPMLRHCCHSMPGCGRGWARRWGGGAGRARTSLFGWQCVSVAAAAAVAKQTFSGSESTASMQQRQGEGGEGGRAAAAGSSSSRRSSNSSSRRRATDSASFPE